MSKFILPISILLPVLLAACSSASKSAAQSATQPSLPPNAAAPRLDAWHVIGPGGGGTMVAPTFSPFDSKTAMVHCDMTGAYITHDDGKSWRMINLRSGVGSIAFDPSHPGVIYAASDALWKSSDNGQTWWMIWPDPKKNTVETWEGDHGEPVLNSDDKSYPGGGDFSISAIAVDPADGNHLVLASAGKVYQVRDGKSFSPMNVGEDSIDSVCFVPHGGTLFAVGASAVYRQDGDGWKTIKLPGAAAAPTGRQRRAAARPVSIAWPVEAAQPTIYVTGPSDWKDGKITGGIYVSNDGGATWQDSLGNLSDPIYQPGQGRAPAVRLISCCATNPLIAYASAHLTLAAGREGTYSAIIKTADGGKTWNIVHKESTTASPNMQGSWFEQRTTNADGSVYFSDCYSLTTSPTDGNICYATDLFRTYMTDDGGKTWRECHSAPVGEPGQDRWTTRGLDVTTCYGVHFDPFGHQNMFISYTDIGMFRSGDGGASWTSSIAGIPREWHNTTYWLEFDPKVDGLMWGAFAGTHDLPRTKMWRNTDPSRFHGGVAISTDGGKKWTVSNTGMPETAVTHILLDPDSPVGSRTLYACGFGTGVFKSTDNGKTWTAKNKGLNYAQPFAWRIVRSSDKSLYLIVSRRTEDNLNAPPNAAPPAFDGNGALYHSTDGAESWTKVNLPDKCVFPNGLAIDPTNPNRMYLAAWARETKQGNEGGGVFVSNDAGNTWKSILPTYPHAYDVMIDPSNPKILYTCGFDYGAYRSTDSGANWQRINGYQFKWGHRVIIDPDHPDMIYITTFGGSVWHGPAAGDPQAQPDAMPVLAPAP